MKHPLSPAVWQFLLSLVSAVLLLRSWSLLQGAWPDDDVDMGPDVAPARLEALLSDVGGGFLLPLRAADAANGQLPQQTMAALVARRMKVLAIRCGRSSRVGHYRLRSPEQNMYPAHTSLPLLATAPQSLMTRY